MTLNTLVRLLIFLLNLYLFATTTTTTTTPSPQIANNNNNSEPNNLVDSFNKVAVECQVENRLAGQCGTQAWRGRQEDRDFENGLQGQGQIQGQLQGQCEASARRWRHQGMYATSTTICSNIIIYLHSALTRRPHTVSYQFFPHPR